ncbi:MAG: hypothetical protein EF807_02245 [Candidatus Methanolliviera hydrocarbonicum]|uniref:AbrB/MazE/SpoVT family DNA-binding domain-containing protein n=1 Tax=Candidatus Methanolliviera hydrocarbonicum TaxID=2491085 RepID=A0A520KXX4_9EURY|nr:MAG: hypothetical protein EF807_02245 [Candidatus Methanolliviera hydrocarbonicum]
MVKLQQIKERSFVYIPKEYIKLKHWEKGTELVLGFNERGNLEIAEVESQPADGKEVVSNLAERQTHATKGRARSKKV